MAKNIEKIEPQPQAMEKVEMPADLQRDRGRGTENIGTDDVRPPRIVLCQKGTPHKDEGPKHIPGLKDLDMFNDLSGEVYGRGPLKFAVIQTFPPRHIEFRPMDEGGGVIDFDVPANDPRTQFTTDEKGNRRKPVATKFYDFLVWLIEQQEIAVLSMKSTQLKVAVQLNGKMKLPLKGEAIHPSLAGQIIPDPPAWARTFSVSTTTEHDTMYTWYNYVLKQEGVTPVEVRETCRMLADTYAKKTIVIPRDQDDSFDPETLEGEADM